MEIYSHEYFMREALREAQKALEQNEVPVGAVLVCNNKIIGRAHNQTERLRDCTAHAEMLVLTSGFHFLGGKYAQSCTLYVTLEPCVMCAGALGWAQATRLVYGASDARRGFMRIGGGSVLHPKTEIIGGVKQEECSNLLQTFFQKIREKNH